MFIILLGRCNALFKLNQFPTQYNKSTSVKSDGINPCQKLSTGENAGNKWQDISNQIMMLSVDLIVDVLPLHH